MVQVMTIREYISMVEEEIGFKIDYRETSLAEFDQMEFIPKIKDLWAKCVPLDMQKILRRFLNFFPRVLSSITRFIQYRYVAGIRLPISFRSFS